MPARALRSRPNEHRPARRGSPRGGAREAARAVDGDDNIYTYFPPLGRVFRTAPEPRQGGEPGAPAPTTTWHHLVTMNEKIELNVAHVLMHGDRADWRLADVIKLLDGKSGRFVVSYGCGSTAMRTRASTRRWSPPRSARHVAPLDAYAACAADA